MTKISMDILVHLTDSLLYKTYIIIDYKTRGRRKVLIIDLNDAKLRFTLKVENLTYYHFIVEIIQKYCYEFGIYDYSLLIFTKIWYYYFLRNLLTVLLPLLLFITSIL